MIFFPVDLAIALTGVVHLFNNIFKLFLVGKNADKFVLFRFGIPAIIFAFVGAFTLINIINLSPIFSYELNGKFFFISPIKFIIAILLITFVMMDLISHFRKLQFEKNNLILGGILSGFFGGLSGHQGALRSIFLIKSGLTKEAFIGTSVVIAVFIDFTRLTIYASHFTKIDFNFNITMIVCAIISGICGSYFGNKLLKKITLKFIQVFVSAILIVISLLLGFGII